MTNAGQSPNVSVERRSSPRRETNLAGTVLISGEPSITCRIRNISDGGALIVFEKPVRMPFGFLLNIEGFAAPKGCEIRHHFGARVGVEFVAVARVQLSGLERYGGEVGNWIETEAQLPLDVFGDKLPA